MYMPGRLPNRLEAFENLDVRAGVVAGRREVLDARVLLVVGSSSGSSLRNATVLMLRCVAVDACALDY